MSTKWLLTTKSGVKPEAIARKLAPLGGRVILEEAPIPLGDGEQVMKVRGPHDLDAKVEGDREILNLYPDSEMTPY